MRLVPHLFNERRRRRRRRRADEPGDRANNGKTYRRHVRTACTRSSVASALKVAFATRARHLPTLFRKSLTLGLATAMATDTSVVRKVGPLGFPYQTVDPFLFCVYHYDDYPEGDNAMRAPRRGDGSDFDWSRPYRMYHGDRIPGFPAHPHRGIETLTVTLEGRVDHHDSAGNCGRYGGGDMQWMTAGGGLQHSEMLPLLNMTEPNPTKWFQIWLNLPKVSKFATGGFRMHWAENVVVLPGSAGGATARLYAGSLGGTDSGCEPPPVSWAADPAHDVMVAVVSLPAGGSRFTLPPAAAGAAANRVAYVVECGGGGAVTVAGTRLPGPRAVTLRADAEAEFVNADPAVPARVLVLQGVPIGEPVAQRGPFVMNTEQEISDAYRDFRSTQFGGWPWRDAAPVFPREKGRFAAFAQPGGGAARVERPPGAVPADSAAAGREL